MEQVFFNLPLSELEPIFKRWIKEAQNDLQSEEFINQNQTEQLLTVEEAAKFLSLAKPTIYLKSKNGEIPSMKQGKRLYFSNKELIDYVKEGRKKTKKDIDLEVDNFFKKKGGKNA